MTVFYLVEAVKTEFLLAQAVLNNMYIAEDDFITLDHALSTLTIKNAVS